MKDRIAITLDAGLLTLVDSKVGAQLQNRSQAIEHFLRLGLFGHAKLAGLIMVSAEHQERVLAFAGSGPSGSKKAKKGNKSATTSVQRDEHAGNADAQPLISRQTRALADAGCQRIIIVTQDGPQLKRLIDTIAKNNAQVVTRDVKGTAQVIAAAGEAGIDSPFFALGGDISFSCSLAAMMEYHLRHGKVATMGLISGPEPTKAGCAMLSGDAITHFEERPSKADSYVINAGIYCFSPTIYSFIGPKDVSLERHVFPRLAQADQLRGWFVPGEYRHVG